MKSLPLFDDKTLLGPVGEEALGPIRKEVEACKRCALHKARSHVVFGEGNSNEPMIMLIGEGPGETEDRTGKPFVGRSGDLLNKMISAIGLSRDQQYVANVIKCRPPENRRPEEDEIANCKPYLLAQVRAVRPKVIVTLGATAGQSLLKTKKQISSMRGNWFEYQGIPVRPTYHPSYLLRAGTDAKKEAWVDLQCVISKLKELGVLQ